MHGVVEGLGDDTETGGAGLFLDLLGEGDFLGKGLRRRLGIETCGGEEILVPVERLGRERDRDAPLLSVRRHRFNDEGVVGFLLVLGVFDRHDEVVRGKLLQRARADIGQPDRGAGGCQRRHLVLALVPADDFRRDLEAGILGFPLLDEIGMRRLHLVAAGNEGDGLVFSRCQAGHHCQGEGHARQKFRYKSHCTSPIVARLIRAVAYSLTAPAVRPATR